MIKYFPVSPDRIITLNNYRVSRWYPFADDIGYFEDPKTIVSVGALIALMGGNYDKLEGFRLNTELLKTKLISTANYIGILDKYTNNINTIYLSPDENSYEIDVSGLPVILGYKQLPNKSYPGRPIYNLDFNISLIRQRVLEECSLYESEEEINEQIEKHKNKLKMRMPFRIILKREYKTSRENITIERIKDRERNELSRNILSLSLMTLSD